MKRGLPEQSAEINVRDLVPQLRAAGMGADDLSETLFVHEVADFLIGRDTNANAEQLRMGVVDLVQKYPTVEAYADALRAFGGAQQSELRASAPVREVVS